MPRPASIVTAVVVTFAIAGIMRLSTRNAGVASKPTTTSRLDSARYQREIVALESMLYQSESPSETDFTSISGALHELGFAIAGREQNPSSRQVAEDVDVLAARADAGDVGYALPDIAALRTDWESLRAERFAQADWFLESTPELEQAQAVPTPSVDDSFVGELEQAIDDIEDLVEEGRRVCDELGEPFYDFEQPSAEGTAHIEKWNEFARAWDDDVTTVASHLPPPPPWNADPEMTAAFQEATRALGELRHVTMGSGSGPVPYRADWEARFDEVVRLLEGAQARLASR